ncbi:MAG TPA: NAD(P)H-hydrate dehydratase [Tissierellia bacterium]|nr:NAD(P)H-hydrate dehydratase [Tissierellia bacterium]
MSILNGVDIVKVSRIEKLMDKHRDVFLNRVFTEGEIGYIKSKNYNLQTVAGLFAAKEAISKLLGTGIGKVSFKHMEIIHDENGKPHVLLHDMGYELFKTLKIRNIEISISHERDYAIAYAVGEAFNGKVSVNVPVNIMNILPKRKKDSHKGDYGRAGIVAGKKGMTGAAYLATMAALRAGSGLVYAIVPDTISQILSIKLTEAIIRPVEDKQKGYFILDSLDEIMEVIKDMDVIAVGPGIGVNEETVQVVRNILLNYDKTIVLDADGLNCLSEMGLDILYERKGDTIITPHPGEMSRLIGVKTGEIQKKRVEYSLELSNKYNITVVLKGNGTVVVSPDKEIYINTTGNPGMATAGSGDVLTGIITSLAGQRIGTHESAVLGVYLHGLAGDLAKACKGEYGMIARDILNNIPNSIKYIEMMKN